MCPSVKLSSLYGMAAPTLYGVESEGGWQAAGSLGNMSPRAIPFVPQNQQVLEMGLYENMLTEPIRQLALRDAITMPAELSVRDAVLRMRDRKLGCVIVVDEQDKPLGMFTEAMLRRLLIDDRSALDDSVQNRMARQFPCAKITDPVVTVLEAMQAENHRFVCVVDETGRVAGLTGRKGLMEYIADHFPQTVLTERAGAESPRSQREGA